MEKRPLLYFYPKTGTFSYNRTFSKLLPPDSPAKEKTLLQGNQDIADLGHIFYHPPPGGLMRIKSFIARDKVGSCSYTYLRTRNTLKPAKLKLLSEHPERPRIRVRTIAVTPMTTLTSQATMIDELLKEREHLLQEINHRVVNNLQIVLSIIHHSMTQDATDPAGTLSKIEEHIFLLSSVHKCIYRSQDIIHIPVKTIITDIIKDLKNSLDLSFEFTVNNSPATFEVKEAIPMAFVCAEFLSNLISWNEHLHNSTVCLKITIRLAKGLLISVTAREKGKNNILPMRTSSLDPVFAAILEQADASITGCSTSRALRFREKTDEISSLAFPIR